MDDRGWALRDLEADPIRTRIGNALRRSRTISILITLLLVLVVGTADYFSGYYIYWSIFYLVAISLALWDVGVLFALLISILSIASWLVGDWAAGVVYPNRFAPVWNTLITFGSYLVVIWLLFRLKSFHQILEARIRDRTMALRKEIAARKELEKEVAEVTERERRQIGHELHDTLCQHLTATSLSLQVLSGKLAEASLPQAKDADQGAELVEQAIELTRNMAKGLFPLELEGEGLAGALLELSRTTMQRHRVICEARCDVLVQVLNPNVATHLYRIAQEAVNNAIKHGHISRIDVKLSVADENLILTITDDGIGLPEELPGNRGLGLRVMASRAGMIGASFSAKNRPEGGTIVMCQLPLLKGDVKNLENLAHASG
jgi:signal transduction histidine kinase